MDLSFPKTTKTSFLGHFRDFLDTPDPYGLFLKNRASSLFLLMKKSEKTDEPASRSCFENGRIEPDFRLRACPINELMIFRHQGILYN